MGVSGILLLWRSARISARQRLRGSCAPRRSTTKVASRATIGTRTDRRRRPRNRWGGDPDTAVSSKRRRPAIAPGSDGCDLCYGPIQVLFDVHLRVPEGQVHALVGRNGVGKTTLLCAIAGLIDAQQGRIEYAGIDLTGVPPDQRVRLGITLMAGGRSTFPTLTVQENLWMGAYPFHQSDALVRQRFDAMLDDVPAARIPAASERGPSRAASSRCSRSVGR